MLYQIQNLKQSLEHQRKDLNACRAEITALKVHIEGSRSSRNLLATEDEAVQPQLLEKYEEEIESLQREIEKLRAEGQNAINSTHSGYSESVQTEEKVVEVDEDKTVVSDLATKFGGLGSSGREASSTLAILDNGVKPTNATSEEATVISALNENSAPEKSESISIQNDEPHSKDRGLNLKADSTSEAVSDKMASSFSFCWMNIPFPQSSF